MEATNEGVPHALPLQDGWFIFLERRTDGERPSGEWDEVGWRKFDIGRHMRVWRERSGCGLAGRKEDHTLMWSVHCRPGIWDWSVSPSTRSRPVLPGVRTLMYWMNPVCHVRRLGKSSNCVVAVASVSLRHIWGAEEERGEGGKGGRGLGGMWTRGETYDLSDDTRGSGDVDRRLKSWHLKESFPELRYLRGRDFFSVVMSGHYAKAWFGFKLDVNTMAGWPAASQCTGTGLHAFRFHHERSPRNDITRVPEEFFIHHRNLSTDEPHEAPLTRGLSVSLCLTMSRT